MAAHSGDSPRAVRKPCSSNEAFRIRKGAEIAFVPRPDGDTIRRAEDLLRWLADTMQGVGKTIRESKRGMRPP